MALDNIIISKMLEHRKSRASEIEKSWLAHCKDKYPRELAIKQRQKKGLFRLKQEIVKDGFFLLSSVARFKRMCIPTYITVYSYDSRDRIDYSQARVDTLYFDFDQENDPALKLALEDVLKLKTYYPEARVYFTGKKGFAGYLDFKEVPLQNSYKKEAIGILQNQIISALDLKTVDPTVIGDIARVSRLPNTIHGDRWNNWNQYCIPLDLEDLKAAQRSGIQYIRNLARAPRFDFTITIVENDELVDSLVEISKKLEVIQRDREIQRKVQELRNKYRVQTKVALRSVVDLDALKKNYRIEDYVRIPKGENRDKEQIMAFCPFHADEHPSFSINTKKQLWYCFAGCGSGSIIDFVMAKEKCDVNEAIRKLKEGWRG